jgi:hypothetical protein
VERRLAWARPESRLAVVAAHIAHGCHSRVGTCGGPAALAVVTLYILARPHHIARAAARPRARVAAFTAAAASHLSACAAEPRRARALLLPANAQSPRGGLYRGGGIASLSACGRTPAARASLLPLPKPMVRVAAFTAAAGVRLLMARGSPRQQPPRPAVPIAPRYIHRRISPIGRGIAGRSRARRAKVRPRLNQGLRSRCSYAPNR